MLIVFLSGMFLHVDSVSFDVKSLFPYNIVKYYQSKIRAYSKCISMYLVNIVNVFNIVIRKEPTYGSEISTLEPSDLVTQWLGL